MAQYKRIGGAIRNWADSLLSIENYRDGSYFVGLLTSRARQNAAEKVIVNVLTGTVSPRVISDHQVAKFTKSVPWEFARHLVNENVNPEMVSSATLELLYDFSRESPPIRGISFSDPGSAPDAAYYQARITVMDDRGVKHEALIPEWWR